MASSSKESANLLGKRFRVDVDLENRPILRRHKEQSEEKTRQEFADSLQGRAELLETKSDQANLISLKETVEGLDQTVASNSEVINKALFVANLSPQTEISDIIDFFKNVGKVVRVQLVVNHEGKQVGYGFVEFASSDEAKKALQNKNSEYLHDCKMSLDVVNRGATHFPPKYCIDHKVWYREDYLPQFGQAYWETNSKMDGFCGKKYIRQESLPTEENVTHPDFVEEVLFVANLSPQTEISHVFLFFINVGEVVSVRLIVNHEGRHVGFGFVEFASSTEAKKALEKKNGEYLHDHKIFLDVAKIAPYPPLPKYNLAAKLCYEDYLRRVSFLIEEDETVEGLDETPDFAEAVAVRKKTLFVANLPCETEPSDIINFFKVVGEVVHVRLMLNHKGQHMGYAFVEFASANEAKKALEMKNGKYLHGHKIFLDKAKKMDPPARYCIDHKVWFEDYLQQENCLMEEHEDVEGLDETPDFVEAVAVRKKTVFVANVFCETRILNIIHFFKDVGEVVRVRLIVNHRGEDVGCAFVEFASTNKAEKALKKRQNRRHRKLFSVMAKTAPYPLRPKYNLAEKLWYEDYLRRESLLVEEDEAVEVLDQTPNLVEDYAAMKKKMVFVVNLCYKTEPSDIVNFFKDVGEVVHVRLVANHTRKVIVYGFVEFASEDEAKKARKKKNGEYLHDSKIIVEKPNFRARQPKYSFHHKVWYHDDYLARLGQDYLETKPNVEKCKMVGPAYSRYGVDSLPRFCGKKITFSYDE